MTSIMYLSFKNILASRKLSCFALPWSAISSLCELCPSLQHLCIAKCIDKAAIEPSLKIPEELERLDLTDSPNLNPTQFKIIAEKCLKLRGFIAEKCPRLMDDNAVGYLCDYGIAKNLVELSLNQCLMITDQSLQLIGHHCHLLARLDVGGCGRITDVGISTITENCVNLKVDY